LLPSSTAAVQIPAGSSTASHSWVVRVAKALRDAVEQRVAPVKAVAALAQPRQIEQFADAGQRRHRQGKMPVRRAVDAIGRSEIGIGAMGGGARRGRRPSLR
jgi:hypothetical protein